MPILTTFDHMKKPKVIDNNKILLSTMQKGAMKGVKRVADAIVEEAKKKVPVDEGNLLRSIDAQQPKAVGKDGASCELGAYADYALYVEYPTMPHDIVPKTREALRWEGEGGEVHFAHRVHHPGTDAQPFMRPAIDKLKARGPLMIEEEIRLELKKTQELRT